MFRIHAVPPRLRTRLTLVPLAIAATFVFAGAGAGVGVQTARAGTDSFCSGSVGPDDTCYGPVHTLTASRGTNNTSGAGCAGAYAYGLYLCAAPAGCHEFSGARLLYPGIKHRSSTSKNMSGYSTWGSTAKPQNCVQGSPYRAVSGPVTEAAADLEGIPALTRRREVAPDRVAALVPAADPATARRFSTPRGDGYVLVDPSTRQVCLAIDDAGTGYGFACTRYLDARQRGALVTLEDTDSSTAVGDVVVAAVPDGSKGLTVTRADGTARTVAPVGGIVSLSLGVKDQAVEVEPTPGADVEAQRMVVAQR